MIWYIGNTTVRTPYRLQEALRALLQSPLNGDLHGRQREQGFAAFLHDQGIVDVARIGTGGDASDLGRKWRGALMKLGFITPALGIRTTLPTSYADGIEGLTGRAYEVTPNGRRLAEADAIAAQQECFLRSMATLRLPSILEDHFEAVPFSPLRFVLDIMHELTQRGESPTLRFEEYALHVQTATPSDGISHVVDQVLDFRARREAAAGQVRRFDSESYDAVAARIARVPSTLDDYADLSFRYLKATGLFRNAGRGIAIVPNKAQLAELVRAQEPAFADDRAYLRMLWQGADLPTDDEVAARTVVADLADQLTKRGKPTPSPAPGATVADIQNLRHELEEQLRRLDEQEYAAKQADCVGEIGAWMEALITDRPASLPEGAKLPKGERPAYLEWIIWRAFLAINSLTNEPWEARRFQIDQDFLPVHCAPGGGPDMVFEFADAIVVVEVTLTKSSRQEAAEGEPVRRHVAKYATAGSGKEVYGLFIALDIDSNTAHTFSQGSWYQPDDTKVTLQIVPMTLADFRTFLTAGKDDLSTMPNKLQHLLMSCRSKANLDAPQWKRAISDIIARTRTAPA